MQERQKAFNDSGHGGGGRPKDAISGGTNFESPNSGFWNLQMQELPFEKEAINIFAILGSIGHTLTSQRFFLNICCFEWVPRHFHNVNFNTIQSGHNFATVYHSEVLLGPVWCDSGFWRYQLCTNWGCARWSSVWYITCWFVLVWKCVQQCLLTGEKCFVAARVIIESPWAIREWTSQFRGKEMERWLLSGFEYIGKGKPTRQLSEWH